MPDRGINTGDAANTAGIASDVALKFFVNSKKCFQVATWKKDVPKNKTQNVMALFCACNMLSPCDLVCLCLCGDFWHHHVAASRFFLPPLTTFPMLAWLPGAVVPLIIACVPLFLAIVLLALISTTHWPIFLPI